MTTSFFGQCNECILRTQDVPVLLLLSFVTATLSGISVFLYSLLLIVSPKPRVATPSEKLYTALSEDGFKTQPQPLPCWVDYLSRDNGDEPIEPAELFMSVVIPAYNEEDRLIGMLEETVNYLENEFGTISPRAQQIVEVKHDKQSRQRVNGKANGHANGRAKPATAPERAGRSCSWTMDRKTRPSKLRSALREHTSYPYDHDECQDRGLIEQSGLSTFQLAV